MLPNAAIADVYGMRNELLRFYFCLRGFRGHVAFVAIDDKFAIKLKVWITIYAAECNLRNLLRFSLTYEIKIRF